MQRAAEPTVEEKVTMVTWTVTLKKPSPTNDPYDRDLDKRAEQEVTVKRTDLQAMIITDVTLQVNGTMASRDVAVTEDTMHEAIVIGAAAIEDGQNTPLINLLDAALLQAVDAGLLDSAQKTKRNGVARFDRLMDTFVRRVINKNFFITSVANFIKGHSRNGQPDSEN